MARGNKPLIKRDVVTPETLHCLCCNQEIDSADLYDSDSGLYKSIGKIPYCKDCINNLYQQNLDKYINSEYLDPEKKAVERVCMALDLYYSDKIYDAASKDKEKDEKTTDTSLIILYIKQVKLYQYRKKDYNSTINDKYKTMRDSDAVMSIYSADDANSNEIIKKAARFFGSGFSDEDYIYLQEQYDDWVTRHECETKAQEEIFKEICLTQLELLKAHRGKQDTKDLKISFQKLLDTAKLQPKQNSGDTTANNQTFGTLIDKWENTRPIPEIDEDLRDVDKIGLYLDVFFNPIIFAR